MAKLVLADGRTIPVVSPTLWDGVEVERETGWDRKKYASMMKSSNVQTAFSIFASMRRAGSPVPFLSIMERTDLIQRIIAQPGDIARAEQEVEGEQEPNPPRASETVEVVAE